MLKEPLTLEILDCPNCRRDKGLQAMAIDNQDGLVCFSCNTFYQIREGGQPMLRFEDGQKMERLCNDI